MLDEHWDVVTPFPERRHFDLDDVQAVVEVFAEAPFFYALHQVGICGRDDPDIHGDDPRVADRRQFPGLDHVEQLDLQRQRQFADLVQEQRAAVCHGDEPFFILIGRGKGAFFMAEELAFEQVLGDRAAVDRNERFVLARAGLVDRLGDQPLAGAALAGYQNVGLARDHFFHDGEDLHAWRPIFR